MIISETGKFDKLYLQSPIANLVKINSAVFELLMLVEKDVRTDG
jgi:hypothetical protein